VCSVLKEFGKSLPEGGIDLSVLPVPGYRLRTETKLLGPGSSMMIS
jgi:hypothetical protein